MTGLPMVFAVWAGRKGAVTPEVVAAFRESAGTDWSTWRRLWPPNRRARGFAPELVREYLTRHIVHELGPREYEGMELFLEYASRGTAVETRFVTSV